MGVKEQLLTVAEPQIPHRKCLIAQLVSETQTLFRGGQSSWAPLVPVVGGPRGKQQPFPSVYVLGIPFVVLLEK